jgi:uncharacterized membrane protein
MSITAILLGLINILIVIAVLVLVLLIAEWILGMLGIAIPPQIRQIVLVIVALIALYLLVALLLGLPGVRIIGFHGGAGIAALSAGTAVHL